MNPVRGGSCLKPQRIPKWSERNVVFAPAAAATAGPAPEPSPPLLPLLPPPPLLPLLLAASVAAPAEALLLASCRWCCSGLDLGFGLGGETDAVFAPDVLAGSGRPNSVGMPVFSSVRPLNSKTRSGRDRYLASRDEREHVGFKTASNVTPSDSLSPASSQESPHPLVRRDVERWHR